MDDRDSSQAEQFAAEQLPTVLHVAGLLTGNARQAEDVTTLAFRRLGRRAWEGDDGRRLRMLYRSMLRAWRRSRGATADRSGGPLELQDLRPESVTATASSPSVGGIISDGLRALTDGERSVLLLHLVAGLDVSAVARTVRRPPHVVRRDLTTSLDFLGDATGTSREQIETRVRTALRPGRRAAEDADRVLAGLTTALAADASRPRRPTTALVGAAAIATAAVVIAAFLIGRSSEPEQVADDTVDAPSIELPSTASGLKLVGFQRIMVTVPEDWKQATPLCINVLGDSVVYPMDSTLPPCVQSPVPGDSVGFGRYDAVEDGDLTFRREHRVLLDEVLLLSNVVQRDGGFVQYAALKRANVAVAVRATERSGLAMILSSIQEVPASYVVVPDCLKLDPEDANDLLGANALNGRVFTDPSNAGSGLPQRVVTQTPAVGSLLPLDATVNLGVIPR